MSAEDPSSWEGLDTSEQDIAEYLNFPGSTPAPTPTGPLVSPLALGGALPPSGASSPPPRRGLAGGLGTFTPLAVCELKALSRLSYLFLTHVSAGDTQKALAVLGVFRALYNDAQATIRTGFSTSAQAALPASLPETAWTTQMQVAMGLSLTAALGESNTALRTAISNMPGNMAALAALFPTFQASLAPGDTSIADYANTPVMTRSDYGAAVGAIARDDLQSCIAPAAPAPTTSDQFYRAPSGTTLRVPTPAPTPSGGGAGGGSTSTGTGSRSSSGGPAPVGGTAGNIMTIAFLALVGYGAYLAFVKDGQTPNKGLSGAPDLLDKARKAAKADAPKMKCVANKEMRQRVSMDELVGPRGYKLAEQIAALPPAQAHPIEDAYFAELERLRPGAPRCV